MENARRWSKEHIRLAFHLYCQIPFGKIDSKNKEIIALSDMIARTPSAIAMKMLNIASLDPAVTSTGRIGLGNASALDREVWEEFHANWEVLAVETQLLKQQFDSDVSSDIEAENELFIPEDFTGETKQAIVAQRIKQHFFRKAVLSSYRGRCCMSGLSEPKLLIASHIVPWSKDTANRLNPSNGLCLSAIHDKAFDKGFISLDDDYNVIISKQLARHEDSFARDFVLQLSGKPINLPERFLPNKEFILRHRQTIFLDNI